MNLAPILSPCGIKMIFYFYAGINVASETGMASGIKVIFNFYAESEVTFNAGMICGIKVTSHPGTGMISPRSQ